VRCILPASRARTDDDSDAGAYLSGDRVRGRHALLALDQLPRRCREHRHGVAAQHERGQQVWTCKLVVSTEITSGGRTAVVTASAGGTPSSPSSSSRVAAASIGIGSPHSTNTAAGAARCISETSAS
jgi:hypothetical protein